MHSYVSSKKKQEQIMNARFDDRTIVVNLYGRLGFGQIFVFVRRLSQVVWRLLAVGAPICSDRSICGSKPC